MEGGVVGNAGFDEIVASTYTGYYYLLSKSFWNLFILFTFISINWVILGYLAHDIHLPNWDKEYTLFQYLFNYTWFCP